MGIQIDFDVCPDDIDGFDDAVHSAVDDQIERLVMQGIEAADLRSLVNEEMPDYEDQITELEKDLSHLQGVVVTQVENIDRLENEINNLRSELEDTRFQHNALVDQLNTSWIGRWLLG